MRAGRTASLSPDCSELCIEASSCVSGCLSVGAKPTCTPDRKLELHLGQHSPALHPDSGLAALWEVKPCSTAPTQLPPHQLSIIFRLLSLLIPLRSFFCQKKMYPADVDTNRHLLLGFTIQQSHIYSFHILYSWAT